MGDPLKTAAQYAMLVGNDVSFGLPKLFLGDDYDRNLAQARRDTGTGGVLASTAANFIGAGGLIKGAAKGLKYVPGAAGSAWGGLKALGGLAARNKGKVAVGSTFPIVAGVKASGGEYGHVEPNAVAAPAQAATPERQFPVNPLAEEAYARGMARKAAMGSSDFQGMGPAGEMLSSLAASQGGRVSMEQLDAIGQFAARTAQPAAKLPGYKDVAGAAALKDIDEMFMRNQSLAQQIRETGKVPELLQEKYGTDANAAAQALWEDSRQDLLAKRMQILGVEESPFPQEGE
jgi:hypothetical protein